MSAATTQPMTGHANQSAPLGALAILVGALALGAVGIALGQGYKAAPEATAPAAGFVPPDVQVVLRAQQLSAAEQFTIHRRGEYRDMEKAAFPGAISGPTTGSQKGLGSPTDQSPSDSPARSGHHRR